MINFKCERCKSAVEDPIHALWSCSELDSVWSDQSLWSFRGRIGFVDFKELLSWMIAKGKPLELFAVMAWMIWNQCNHVCMHHPAAALHQVATLACTSLTEFQIRQTAPETVKQVEQGRTTRWLPPPADLAKINFDRAVFTNDNSSRIGVVVRDGNVSVLASCTKKLNHAYSGEHIEALAAATALSFASEVGIKQVVLEGDSLAVINALKEGVCLLTPSGLLVEDVKVLSQRFDQLLYSHTKRDGNSVAHSLAKYAIHIPDFLVWMEDVLSQLHSVLQADLEGFS